MEIIKWLLTSSADPEKYSLFVKGVLSLAVAKILEVAALTCGLHLVCVSIDQSVLESAVLTIANIVYMALSIVGMVASLWGLARKFWLNSWSAYSIPPANLPTA